MRLDAGHNLPHLAADAYLGAEQLLGFLHCLAGNDLAHLELELREILKGDLGLCLDVDDSRSAVSILARRVSVSILFPASCSGSFRLFFRLHLCQNLVYIEAGKENLRLIRHLRTGLVQAEHVHDLKGALLRAQLGQDLRGGLRHEGLQQAGADADGLHQVVEHRRQAALLALILRQGPGHGLVNVFVAALEQIENLCNRVRHTQLVHLIGSLLGSRHRRLAKLAVHRLDHLAVAHDAAEIFIGHGNGAVYQVAQGVRKLGIDALHHQLPGNHAVVVKGHLMQHEEAHGVHAELLHQIVRIEHISLGLAHLAVSLQKPRMAEHLLWQRQVESHQENGPVNGVETDDVLSDQVQIRRPVLLEEIAGFSVAVVSDSGDIVGQGVQPHVNHMLRVKVHRNSPLEGGTGHAEILQARKQEIVHHLVFPGNRLYKFRMLVDVVDQPIRVLTHTEEIRLFLGRLHLAAAVRALAVHQLGRGPEGLAGRAVQALVGSLVNVALLVKLLENLLYLLLVIIVRGADELVIGSVH